MKQADDVIIIVIHTVVQITVIKSLVLSVQIDIPIIIPRDEYNGINSNDML